MLYSFSYGLASANARRNRLTKIENKVDNITKTATLLNKLLLFIPLQQALAAHALNTDCLAASNGVCTKRNTSRNTAWFGLLLVENEVNIGLQT